MERGYDALVTPEPLAVYRRWEGALTSSQATSARSDRLAYERALERGRLSPPQARIARRRLRYSRAVELVATAVSGSGSARSVARRRMLPALPSLVRVALENPGQWPDWARGAATRIFRGHRREYAR
jgi:hypothetical protein